MSICVPLRRLRWLTLDGDSRHVLTLLGHRLEYPVVLDQLDIALYGCTLTEIPETIGSYSKNRFQRRGGSQSGLLLDLKSSDRIVLHVGGAVGAGPSCVWLDKVVKFVASVWIRKFLDAPSFCCRQFNDRFFRGSRLRVKTYGREGRRLAFVKFGLSSCSSRLDGI